MYSVLQSVVRIVQDNLPAPCREQLYQLHGYIANHRRALARTIVTCTAHANPFAPAPHLRGGYSSIRSSPFRHDGR